MKKHRNDDVAELIAAGPAELRVFDAARLKLTADDAERDPDAAALVGNVLAAMMAQATAGARFECAFCRRPFTMRTVDTGGIPIKAAAIAILNTPRDFCRDDRAAIVAAPICTSCDASSADPLRDRVLAHFRNAHPELILFHAADIAASNSTRKQ